MHNQNIDEQNNQNFAENSPQTANPILSQNQPHFAPKTTVQNKPYVDNQNRPLNNQNQNYQQQSYQQQNYQPQSYQPQNSNPNQSNQRRDVTEYQPQNQYAFKQWQEIRRQEDIQARQQFISQQITVPSLWRQNDKLVVHKFGKIPNRCVKCNEYVSDFAGSSYVSQKYRWHHPLVYIALISPLIFLILSLALSKKVTLDIPLCTEHIEEKKTIGGYLAGIGVFSTISFALFLSLGYFGFAFFLAFMALIGLAIGNEYFHKPLRVSKIEDDYVYLNGVDSDFLNQVP